MREWTKEREDNATARANEKANNSQNGFLAINASDSSFITSVAK